MRKKLVFLCIVVTGMAYGLAAQSVSPVELQRQITAMQQQLQKQQDVIDQLRQSQQELQRQLEGSRAQQPQTAAQPPASSAAPGTEARPTTQELPPSAQASTAEAPSTVRASQYTNWQVAGRGINLGDRVRLGGYGSVRFETNDVATGNNVPGGSAGSFTFRRLVLTTDVRPAPRLRIYTETEMERLFEIESEKGFERSSTGLGLKQTIEGNNGGSLELEQAWAQYDFAERHGLRMGIVLTPVGRFNLLHDDDYWDIPRRTLTDRDAPVLPVKSAWRELGAGLVGSFNIGKSGKLDYQAYALNGAALDFNMEHELETEAGAPGAAEQVVNAEMQLTSGPFDGTRSAAAFAWRLAYSPSLRGEFALSGYHGKYAPSFLSFREPLTSIAYDHKWRYKGFETEAEVVYTSLGRLNRVLDAFAVAAFNSANATLPTSSEGGLTTNVVELELANLSRTRAGVWSDFKYHARPKWLKSSFLGRSFEDPQIIPIIRYERVWLNGVTDDIEVSGGSVTGFTRENLQQERVTAGISFRPVLQFSIQAAYEHNRKVEGSRLIFPRVAQDSTNGFVFGMSFAF
jgi:hypothetical protein